MVGRVFPLEEGEAAFELLAHGRTRGKIVPHVPRIVLVESAVGFRGTFRHGKTIGCLGIEMIVK